MIFRFTIFFGFVRLRNKASLFLSVHAAERDSSSSENDDEVVAAASIDHDTESLLTLAASPASLSTKLVRLPPPLSGASAAARARSSATTTTQRRARVRAVYSSLRDSAGACSAASRTRTTAGLSPPWALCIVAAQAGSSWERSAKPA